MSTLCWKVKSLEGHYAQSGCYEFELCTTVSMHRISISYSYHPTLLSNHYIIGRTMTMNLAGLQEAVSFHAVLTTSRLILGTIKQSTCTCNMDDEVRFNHRRSDFVQDISSITSLTRLSRPHLHDPKPTS